MLLTEVVNQEVGGETLGAVAHGGVVVRVSSEHQHGAAHDHGRVQVTEEAAVSEDGPAQTQRSVKTAPRPPPGGGGWYTTVVRGPQIQSWGGGHSSAAPGPPRSVLGVTVSTRTVSYDSL